MATTTNTTSSISIGGLLGIVFVVLKLTNVITWSWWWVTLPFWGPSAVLLIMMLILFFFGLLGLLFHL